MSFAQDNGYTPQTFEEIMDAVRLKVNSEFNTTFTTDNFIGTNWYKYAYGYAQLVQAGEIETSEVFVKLQEYINIVNQRILEPSVSYNGLLRALTTAGFEASLKPILEVDAGKVFVCVNLDDEDDNYAAQKLLVAQTIEKYTVAGVFYMGDEDQDIVLTNGQTIVVSFELPDVTPIILRAVFVKSSNVSLSIPTEEELREEIFESYQVNYNVGLNFEPQRIYNQDRAPWAETVTIEWSDDNGANWFSSVYVAAYTDLLLLEMGDIEVLIS